MLNKWWNDEQIPEEALRAKVILIFKKGDSSNLENYRPISLLNTCYKIFAAILQKRIAKTIDPFLQQKPNTVSEKTKVQATPFTVSDELWNTEKPPLKNKF